METDTMLRLRERLTQRKFQEIFRRALVKPLSLRMTTEGDDDWTSIAPPEYFEYMQRAERIALSLGYRHSNRLPADVLLDAGDNGFRQWYWSGSHPKALWVYVRNAVVNAWREHVSTYVPFSFDDLHEIVEYEGPPSDARPRFQAMRRLVDTLPDRERQIITLHSQGVRERDLSARFGISQQRISQIIKATRVKLRKAHYVTI